MSPRSVSESKKWSGRGGKRSGFGHESGRSNLAHFVVLEELGTV